MTGRDGRLTGWHVGIPVRAPALPRPGALVVVIALLAGVLSGCVGDVSEVDRLRMEEAVGVGARFYERVGRGAYAEAVAMSTLEADETPEERIADLRRVEKEVGPVQRARLAGRTWDWSDGETSFVLEYHVERAHVVSNEVLKLGARGPDGAVVITGYGVDWDPGLVTP